MTPRTNRPPDTTSVSEAASCATTSHRPVALRPVTRPASPRNSPAEPGLESDHAGPSAKHAVLNAPNPTAATTRRPSDGSTIISMPNVVSGPASPAPSTPVVTQPIPTPRTAPIDDSVNPSMNS